MPILLILGLAAIAFIAIKSQESPEPSDQAIRKAILIAMDTLKTAIDGKPRASKEDKEWAAALQKAYPEKFIEYGNRNPQIKKDFQLLFKAGLEKQMEKQLSKQFTLS